MSAAPNPAGSAAAAAPTPAPVPPRLEIIGLTGGYGRIQALYGVDLTVGEGELVALVGANGAGKTTLMRLISGLLPATGGSIRYQGVDIGRISADRRVGLGIAQVPEGRQVFGPMTVEENLRLGAYTRPRGAVAAALEEVLDLFPALRSMRRQAAGTLSGGQQQMLAMGRALMARPKLLLLDEPSMGLAPILVDETFAMIGRLRAAGMTIFLVEQNAFKALAIADRGYVLESGRTVLSDSGPALLANDRVRGAYLGV